MVRIMMALAGLLIVGAGVAQTPLPLPAEAPITVPNYSDPATWICRPGVDDGTCSANLDAVAIDAQGHRTPVTYAPAKAPKIDCFYIYPTASMDPGTFSDMNPGPEEKRAVHGQFARLGSVCRLFAPIYHQFTIPALRRALAGQAKADSLPFDVPYRDVLAAWRHYLAHDNQGRGVILLGHSQGAILLKRLIAEEIDGKPAQKKLVAAYLAGNPDLTASSFHAIPTCKVIGQTGCIVAWSDYRDGDDNRRAFGAGKPGDPALCVNPASPGGGRAPIKAFLPRPGMAPESDPPYIELIGQLSAECVSDAAGAVLRVRIEPGVYADLLTTALNHAGMPGWGLHPLDMSLPQGNIVDMAAAQSAAWKGR